MLLHTGKFIPNMSKIIWVKSYDSPGAALLSHQVKHNDIKAIRQMAFEMKDHVPPGSVLVPVPGHTGIAIATKTLALHISALTDCPVYDYVRGISRESLYMIKKRGLMLPVKDFGFTLLDSLSDFNVILIDHIHATGCTYNALRYLIPHARILVHSKDTRPLCSILNNKPR